MPRDLPLGNGDLLVTFDSRYQLRDIYYARVGLGNPTGGEPCRFGIWADGKFAWTGDDGWERDLRFAHETLVSEVTLGHAALGVRIRCRDAVDFDRPLYVKEVTIEDVTGRDRDVRLFQHFDARLWGNDIGDSAFYDPRTRAIVHYKGRRYFLLTGVNAKGESGLTSFAIGLKEALGREGTWRDAEDGELSRNLVAQGSIDSVGMLALHVPASALATATFVIAAGQTYDEVRDLDKLVRERGAGSFLSRTGDYWNLWANKDLTIADHLPEPLVHLYKQSTLVIRTQVDNRGAIIAGNDSDVLRFNRDTYSYLWPRDGALVANALDLAGYGEVTRRFFYLCGELMTRDGYLLHKYNPDGSLGSSWHAWSTPDGRLELPIQEDETGLPIWALWQHYDRDRDIEFVRPLYRKLVRTGADFMSIAGIFLFGMLPADDARVVATMRALEARLWVKTVIGGFARYENDYYFQQSQDIANVPGNPWFVATLWVAEHHIATAKTIADLDRPRELLEWCATKANRSGVLAEQVHPLTGDPLSVAPLTWSHAAYVGAVQRYARRSHLLKDKLRERAKSAGEVIA